MNWNETIQKLYKENPQMNEPLAQSGESESEKAPAHEIYEWLIWKLPNGTVSTNAQPFGNGSRCIKVQQIAPPPPTFPAEGEIMEIYKKLGGVADDLLERARDRVIDSDKMIDDALVHGIGVGQVNEAGETQHVPLEDVFKSEKDRAFDQMLALLEEFSLHAINV